MHKNLDDCSIALVYDHLLTKYGGAEVVIDACLAAFPQAELFTTIIDTKNTEWTKKAKVHTSGLQRFFAVTRHREVLDLLTPVALESFSFGKFDIVISITSSAAKGIITGPHQLHVSYILSPTRYLYHAADELLENHWLLSLPLFKQFTQLSLNYLRWWDQVAARRPDKIITLSHKVADRIESIYNRKPDQILYPPIPLPVDNPQRFKHSEKFWLCISRLMPYKRLDLAIGAAVQTKKFLVIAGTGREEKRLQQLAGSQCMIRKNGQTIESAIAESQEQHKYILFTGICTPAEKAALYANCTGFILPGVEDFGITPLEANSYGKPVIVTEQSGVAEVITDGITGIHCKEQTVPSLIAALEKCETMHYTPAQLCASATQFTQEQFVRKLHNIVFAFFTEHSTIKQ